MIERSAPDAIVWWSDWETAELKSRGGTVEVDTPEGDALLMRRMEAAFRRLHEPGVPIVILTVPPTLPSADFPLRVASEDDKHHRLNELFRRFAARHRGDVVVIDLAEKLCPRDPCPERVEGVATRPYDGLHLTPQASAWVARWLWPRIADAAQPFER